MAAWIDGSSEFRGSMTDIVMQAIVTGEAFQLPAGPVGVSFGVERLDRRAGETPDQVLVSNASSASFFNVFSGRNVTNAAWAETVVPILRDRPFFDYLGLELGARYSSLDPGTHNWTYKALAEWSPIPQLSFRGGIQRAVRNPVAIELFGREVSQNQNLGDDPCRTGAPLTGLLRDRCILTGFPAALANSGAPAAAPIGTTSFNGNPALTPEIADTFTIGFVVRDLPVRNFSLTADYFDIRIRDAIGFIGTANIYEGCYRREGGADFCDRIDRDATGTITEIRQDRGNLARVRSRGIDIGINYRIDVPSLMGASASFRIRANATYMLKSLSVPFPLDPSISFSCVGFYAEQCASPIHRFASNTTFAWNDGPLTLSLTWQHLSRVTDAAEKYNVALFPTLPLQSIPAADYFQVSAVWLINDHLQLRFGVDNLFDREPVNVGSTRQLSLGGTYARAYESIGRRFWAGARINF
jgi:iron complex outermembrane recepter protein